MSDEQKDTGAVLAPKTVEPTMEVLRYKEELASKMGLPSPYAMGIMKELAHDLVASGMVPKCWAGNPMAVYGAALRGREMGFQPMESIFEVFWAAPGGNLGMYAKKMLQVMHQGGVTSEFLKEDAEACEILFTPPPPHKPYTAKFHISEAKDAKLIKDDSNWMKWRVDMNRARAISRGWRGLLGTFKGGTSGLYSKEEMEDTGMLDTTTGNPTESDRQRVEVLQAQEEKYKVGLKATAEPPKDPVPPATNVVEMPTKAADPKPEPVGQEVTKAPEPKPVQFEIHVMLPTAGNGKLKPVICPDETQTAKTAASLRAQAMANATGQIHVVVEYDPNANDRGEPARVERDRCHPPKKQETPAAPKSAATSETKPEPTPEPKTEPPTTTEAKQPDAIKMAAKERLEALVPIVGIPAQTAMRRFTAYMAGFVGCPIKEFTAQPLDKRMAALESLEYTIRADKEEFNSGPEQSGERRAKRYNNVLEFLSNLWKGHPDTIALGMKLFQQWDQSAEQFQKWVQMDNIELDFRPMEDVHASLRLLLRTREGAYLMKTAKDHNLSVAAIVDQIEKRALMAKVEDAPVSSIENAVKAYIQAVKEELRKPVAKPEPEPEPEPPAESTQEPPAAEGEDDSDDLFSAKW